MMIDGGSRRRKLVGGFFSLAWRGKLFPVVTAAIARSRGRSTSVLTPFVLPPTPIGCLENRLIESQRGTGSRRTFHYFASSKAGVTSTSLVARKMTKFYFDPGRVPSDPVATVVVGKKSILGSIDIAKILGDSSPGLDVFSAMLERADCRGTRTSVSTSFLPVDGEVRMLSICVIPEKTTRNNHPLSLHSVKSKIASVCPSKGNIRVIVVAGGINVDNSIAPGAIAASVARAFPVFSRKTNGDRPVTSVGEVHVTIVDESGDAVVDRETIMSAEAAADGVRLAARLGDLPPDNLTTAAFAEECREIAAKLGVSITEILGDELRERGYGGLYGVGKAASCPPRLIVMTYEPPRGASSPETIAMVGKGIVYDTGGLAIKPRAGMCGMKFDMCGAAGLLGGFVSAVKIGVPQRLHLLLCLAENAVGPTAFRNDDILTMLSGKTVEVNNSDAEGRLVLADGVFHATKNIEGLDLVVDMATLTGAQGVATGKKHAAVLANTAELEQRAVRAGLRSGDLCFPVLYAPELLLDEFKSKVADMKNSVKDRSNAQSSCAGHFIERHLDPDYGGGWLHLDMAAPAVDEERATGYGVAFILSLLKAPGF